MNTILANSGGSGSSYFGLLDVLDSQEEFYLTSPQLAPLLVTVSSAASIYVDSLLLPK
jgi:hypothetical protein